VCVVVHILTIVSQRSIILANESRSMRSRCCCVYVPPPPPSINFWMPDLSFMKPHETWCCTPQHLDPSVRRSSAPLWVSMLFHSSSADNERFDKETAAPINTPSRSLRGSATERSSACDRITSAQFAECTGATVQITRDCKTST
jgi:hypothetical protein